MARKKEERAIRAAHRKEKKAQKYLTDGESLASFIIQLNKLGLELREIPGDGNCLFRALGDQLDGHSKSHLNHRQDVARFMAEHRPDFEPFVEDDVPFEQHIRCLRSPGTYAGNDAIVAFARLHQLTVVIHQLNSPLWEIHGATKAVCRQIHISYHNGDHYSSVRRIGDHSESPNNIHFLNGKVIDIADMTAPILPQLTQLALTASNQSGKAKTGSHCSAQASTGSNRSELVRPSKTHPPVESKSELDKSGPALLGTVARANGGGLDNVRGRINSDGEGLDELKGGERCVEEGLTGRFVGVSEEKRRSLIDNLAVVSGCKDKGLIDDLLLDHGCDFESTLMALRSVMSGSSSPAISDITSDSDTSTSSNISSSAPLNPPLLTVGGVARDNSSGAKPKAKQSRSHHKRDRKLEKKAKAEQRHRERVLSQRPNSLVPGHQHIEGGRVASSDESDVDSIQLNGTVITTTDRLQVLQI